MGLLAAIFLTTLFSFLFLYSSGQLRFIQGSRQSIQLPLVDERDEKNDRRPYNNVTHPCTPAGMCTHTTNRSPHAMYAYTGIPCAAYIPYHRHQQADVKTNAGRTTLPKLN